METQVNDYNFTFNEVKSEPTEFATLTPELQSYGYSRVEIDRENAEISVTIKKEEYASTTLAKTNVVQDISNIGAARNLNIKLNSSYSNRESREEDANESDLKISNVSHVRKKSLVRPIDNELKCHVYPKNRRIDILEHDNEKYESTVCSRNFKMRKNIFKRMQLHVEEKMLEEIPNEASNKYKICTSIFKRKGEALEHSKINERKFTCELCTKRFTTKQHLSDHVKIHTGERNYKCEFCAKRFVTKGHLSSHTKTHTGERNHKCEICTKRFVTNGDLLKHAIVHTGERNHKCETCAKCFATKDRLSSHVKTHTGGGNYECDICAKRLITKQSLANHVKIHTGERNYKCEVCTKRFMTKQKLSNHVTTHTGRRNFKCEICGKRFVTKWHLSNHVKTHTGEKDYVCDVCAKCFTIKQNLLTHVKIHGREGKHECQICTKRFVTKRNLSEHLKVHIGERNSFLEYKEKRGGGKHVRKFVEKIEEVFIKEETDTSERKPPTVINADSTDAIKDEKLKLTETFELWQTFNSEILVKEEENMTAT